MKRELLYLRFFISNILPRQNKSIIFFDSPPKYKHEGGVRNRNSLVQKNTFCFHFRIVTEREVFFWAGEFCCAYHPRVCIFPGKNYILFCPGNTVVDKCKCVAIAWHISCCSIFFFQMHINLLITLIIYLLDFKLSKNNMISIYFYYKDFTPRNPLYGKLILWFNGILVLLCIGQLNYGGRGTQNRYQISVSTYVLFFIFVYVC